MSFINPLALLLALFGGLIVLMYLLKLRRRRVDVSSTLLWRRSLEDLIANAPFQKLRQNPLMYLQLLLILLLALALARPAMWLQRQAGVTRILILDNSASMSAMDGAPVGARLASRLDAAKTLARQLVDNMALRDQSMLISIGGNVRVCQPFTGEKALLRAAINQVEPTDAEDNIREALLLAQGVRQANPQAILTIISDGGFDYLGNLVNKTDPIEFLGVGRSADNRGFVAFDVRESFEERGKVEAFAEIENFADQPANVLVRCLIDGQLVQTREARLAPKSAKGFVFSGLEGGLGKLLRLELAGQDLLAADNAVEAVINLDTQLPILLVSEGNFFLERVLALLPRAKVTRVAPHDYKWTGGRGLTVFDHFSPPALGSGSYLFLNAVPPLPGFTAGPKPLKDQVILDWNHLHPVTRYLKFASLAVGDALECSVPEWVTPLVESAQTPLIVAGEYGGIRLIGIGFDIYASDWPLQTSFPVFIANAAQWLAGPGAGGLRASRYKSGATIALEAAGPLEILAPGGERWKIEPTRDRLAYFDKTLHVGLYQARQGKNQVERFTVNLLSRKESDIRPQKVLNAGERQITAAQPRRENREIWPWVVLLGLVTLVVEWHLYCRKAWL